MNRTICSDPRLLHLSSIKALAGSLIVQDPEPAGLILESAELLEGLLARHGDEESDPAEWPAWTDADRWEPSEPYEPSETDLASLPVLLPEDMEDDPSYADWVERMAMDAAWSTTFGCIISACNDPSNIEA